MVDNVATFSLGTPTAGTVGTTMVVCWSHHPIGLTEYTVPIDADMDLTGPDRVRRLPLPLYVGVYALTNRAS